LVKAIPYHPSSTHAFTFKKSTKDTLLKLRGGDLGPISSDALAKTFGVLAIGDAVAGTVAPIEVWDKFGIKVEPKSKGEHYLGHGIGSSASSLAVTSLLANNINRRGNWIWYTHSLCVYDRNVIDK